LLRDRGRYGGPATGGGRDHQKKQRQDTRGRIVWLRTAVRGRCVCRLRFSGRVRLVGRSVGRSAVVGRTLDRRVHGADGRRGRARTPRSASRRLHPPVAPATAAKAAAGRTEAVRRRRRVETEEATVQQEREPRTRSCGADVFAHRRREYTYNIIKSICNYIGV